MNDTKSIINRMKEAFKIKTNKELSEKLGTSLSNIDNWKKRNTIPQKYLLLTSQMTNINPDWLLTGEGEMYKTQHIIDIKNSIVGQAGHNIKGDVTINTSSANESLKELCEAFQKLPTKKQKYYYHKIMADYFEIDEKEE